jgi:hypothetical protein
MKKVMPLGEATEELINPVTYSTIAKQKRQRRQQIPGNEIGLQKGRIEGFG